MSDPQNDYARQQILIAALRDPRRYPHAAHSVQLIETHISWVLLAGDYAYKIKKAIDLGFLDYTRLDARRFYCGEEIRLNRRTAPDIYLDTVAIGGSLEKPEFGAQPAFEYAVKMRRFDSAGLMGDLLRRGKISAQQTDRLAAGIARFHASLPAADAGSSFGTAASVKAAAMQNFGQLRALLTAKADRESIAALEASTEAEFADCREIFETRRRQGFVRECHGDLHLGNIVLIGDELVPFDGIEFNPALRWIDVMDEIAFSVMDLLHRDHPGEAWRLLNAWLEAGGDYGGLSVLRFYLAYRAAVRAKVCAIRAGQADISRHAQSGELAACRRYLALARQCLGQYRPALIITHGLPGSGKTTFSQLALQRMGAIRIRSDVERKRLFGLGALESSRPQAGNIYSPEATRQTYARLHELAGGIITAGFTAIVDAAFLRQDERDMFCRLAQGLAVPFAIASLHADDSKLRERLRQRRNDASEADVAVLEMLQAGQQPLSARDLARSVEFTTEEAPDSKANRQAWDKLARLSGSA
ncbi:MAG: AAA family ATPase [Nitrosomonadales bacterium]|nr:AAA family ATPase [Nitrosomonadales bacterium]